MESLDWCGDDPVPENLDADAADRIARDLRLESLLRAELKRRPAAARFRTRRWLLPAAAVLAVAAALGAWQLAARPAEDPSLPRLAMGRATAGQSLAAPADGDLALAWDDGSGVRLQAGGRARIPAAGDAVALLLDRGGLTADIAPRSGAPFRIRTGEGCAEVLGTAFDLASVEGWTRLAVHRGRVRLALPEGEAHLVASGGLAWAGTDGSLIGVPPPGTPLWSIAPAEVRQAVAGTATSPSGAAILVARAQAAPATVFGVHAKADPLCAWDERAEVRCEYRVEGPVPWMGIWIQAPDRQDGNYYLPLPTPVPGRWRSFAIPLAAIPVQGPVNIRPQGRPLRWIHIQAGWAAGASLQVAGLRLER